MSFDFEALQRTFAFLATPHLLTVMSSVADGQQPYATLPGVMPEQIDGAVQRLLEVGAVRLVVHDGDHAADTASCPLALTRKGRIVLQLVRDLHEPLGPASVLADSEPALLSSEQLTER